MHEHVYSPVLHNDILVKETSYMVVVPEVDNGDERFLLPS